MEKVNVQVIGYITESEREALAAAAALDNRKVSAWVRLAIREKIDREANHDQSATA